MSLVTGLQRSDAGFGHDAVAVFTNVYYINHDNNYLWRKHLCPDDSWKKPCRVVKSILVFSPLMGNKKVMLDLSYVDEVLYTIKLIKKLKMYGHDWGQMINQYDINSDLLDRVSR